MCFLVLLDDLVLLLFVGSRSHGQSAVGTRVGLDRRELLGLLILIVSPCRRCLDSFTNLIVFQILFVQIVGVLATRGDIFTLVLVGAVSATWRQVVAQSVHVVGVLSRVNNL